MSTRFESRPNAEPGVWQVLRASLAAHWHADWRLGHDPVTGFEQGVRKRMRSWQPRVASLSEAVTAGMGCYDGVHEAQAAKGWEVLGLPESTAQAWSCVRPGGWLLLRSALPKHEVVAVLTAQGWLLEQVTPVADGSKAEAWYVLQRPLGGELGARWVDWRKERQHWQARGGIALAEEPPWGKKSGQNGRRCHVFGVGIAKGGTRSLAGLFGRYRSAHEAAAASTIEALAAAAQEPAIVCDWTEWVRRRDVETGRLECDSSQLNAWYVEALVTAFPEAKFVLTLREPLSWLRSFVDHRLARGLSPVWASLQELRFGRGKVAREGLLADYGLPELEALLGYWREHHQRVLASVPKERLVVVPLERLEASREAIARFVGVPAGTLEVGSARLNEAGARFAVVERLPQAWLESKAEQVTGDVWRELKALAIP